MLKQAFKYVFSFFLASTPIFADTPNPNQTDMTTPILVNQFNDFQVKITKADFKLPNGIQSYSWATYSGEWFFIGGRTNGMHGFNEGDTPPNFPPLKQNEMIYVVNPSTGKVYSRSLRDAKSGLTTAQIDSLNVTSAQPYWYNGTLYITGGYGYDTASGKYTTKPILTAIDLRGMINWVKNPNSKTTAAQFIRQISNPVFQVAGGTMDRTSEGMTILAFGNNFNGAYLDGATQVYTYQVRRFYICDDGDKLKVKIHNGKSIALNENFGRRDLNVEPVIKWENGKLEQAYVAYSGVFTGDGGIWTVPVEISRHGNPFMANPEGEEVFKQGMNNYQCANMGLFSELAQKMYAVFFGGITYLTYENGQFIPDFEFPFTNQVSTIVSDVNGAYTQYLMNCTYPTIYSKHAPGLPLLFGVGARFIVKDGVPTYDNLVIQLDKLPGGTTLVGYIIGGIQSSLPNTTPTTYTGASPHIFKVTVTVPPKMAPVAVPN